MFGFTIIGPGRVGGALAIALNRVGYRIDALIDRKGKVSSQITRRISPRPVVHSIDSTEEISSEVVLITTPDRNVEDASFRLPSLLTTKNKFVFHTSGSLSSLVLQPLSAAGRSIGSIHPLVSVSSPTLGAEQFAGSFFCIEGDPGAVRVGVRSSKRLGGRPFSLSAEAKPLYHLAAVLAAGHLVALADVALSLMSRTGLGTEMSRAILLPLIKSTVANLESQPPEDALTGPIARGDVSVVQRHLEVLTRIGSTNEREVYLDLALRSIDIVEKRPLRANLDELRKLILLAKQNAK
jgi:predicted short-subunit dehydrogenase-like oxidoreductase (DUF2520 family)